MKTRLIILFLLAVFALNAQPLKWLLTDGTNLTPDYVSNGGISATTGTSLSVSYPGSTASGGVLILAVATKANTTITDPSGWTKIGGNSNASYAYEWFYKLSTGSESGTISVTVGTSTDIGGIMYYYEEVNQSIVHNSSAAIAITTASSSSGSVTGSTGNLGVEVCVMYQQGTGSSISGTGWVQDIYLNTSSGNGFSFLASSYVFSEAETSENITTPNLSSTWGKMRIVLND